MSYKGVDGRSGVKDCPKCGGSGYTPCPDCRSGMQTAAKVFDALTFGAGATYGHGSGKCSKCGGSGEIVCKKCKGSGDCQTCNGTGLLTCEHCNGSGDCPNCDDGKVTCKRCEGSGYYQTYIRRNATLYSKSWRWGGSTDYKDIIKAANGLTLHDGVVKQWASAAVVENDAVEAANMRCAEALGEEKELYKEFLDQYAGQVELSKPSQNFDKPYAKSLKVQRVPVTKIRYQLNGEDFEVLIVGDNNIVATKSIPKVVKGFELSRWKKLKLAMSEKSRLKAYARLGAYIFQRDGKSIEEARVLDSMIKALKMKPSQESKFREELSSLNANMPYDKLRKLIKPLLKSKKTITFAWECMAVDKKVSQEEIELFNNIVAEYKLDSDEIERLKALANKFSKLKGDQIAIEYADLSDELSSIRRKTRNIILIVGALLLAVIGFITFKILSPSNPGKDSELIAPVTSTEDNLSESQDISLDNESEIESLIRAQEQMITEQIEDVQNIINTTESDLSSIASIDDIDEFEESAPLPELNHATFKGQFGNESVTLTLDFNGYNVIGTISSPILGTHPYKIKCTIENTSYEDMWDFNGIVDTDNSDFRNLKGVLKYTGSDYVLETRFMADDPNRTLTAKAPASK